MQGGTPGTHPEMGAGARRTGPVTPQHRESAPARQVGPFSAACQSWLHASISVRLAPAMTAPEVSPGSGLTSKATTAAVPARDSRFEQRPQELDQLGAPSFSPPGGRSGGADRHRPHAPPASTLLPRWMWAICPARSEHLPRRLVLDGEVAQVDHEAEVRVVHLHRLTQGQASLAGPIRHFLSVPRIEALQDESQPLRPGMGTEILH